jgi:hypothetical protein
METSCRVEGQLYDLNNRTRSSGQLYLEWDHTKFGRHNRARIPRAQPVA